MNSERLDDIKQPLTPEEEALWRESLDDPAWEHMQRMFATLDSERAKLAAAKSELARVQPVMQAARDYRDSLHTSPDRGGKLEALFDAVAALDRSESAGRTP